MLLHRVDMVSFFPLTRHAYVSFHLLPLIPSFVHSLSLLPLSSLPPAHSSSHAVACRVGSYLYSLLRTWSMIIIIRIRRRSLLMSWTQKAV